MIGKIKTIILDILVILGIGSIFIDIPEIILSVIVSLSATLQAITLKEYIEYKEPKEEKNTINIEQSKGDTKEEENTNEKTLSLPKYYNNQNEKQKTYVKTKFKK